MPSPPQPSGDNLWSAVRSKASSPSKAPNPTSRGMMPLLQLLVMAKSLRSAEAMPTALYTAPCCSGSSGTGTCTHSKRRVVNWLPPSPYSHNNRQSATSLSAAVVTAFLVGKLPATRCRPKWHTATAPSSATSIPTHPEGHAGQLSIELGKHLAHSLGSSCGGGDDVGSCAAPTPPVLACTY